VKRSRKILLAEEAKVGPSTLFALWIDDCRQLANVPASQREGDVPRPGALLELLVWVASRLGLGRMPDFHQPANIAQQVYMSRIADPQAGTCAVPV
jgi:hypothetical protein